MRYALFGAAFGRIALDAEQEFRADEQALAAHARCRRRSCRCARPSRYNASSGSMSASVTGRRYARRASVDRIVRGARRPRPPRSACAPARQTKMPLPARRVARTARLVRAADFHAAQWAPMRVSGMLTPAGYGRRNGSRTVSSSAEVILRNANVDLALARLHANPHVPVVVGVIPLLALCRGLTRKPCIDLGDLRAAARRPPAGARSASTAAAGRRASTLGSAPWTGVTPGSVNTWTRSPSMLTSRLLRFEIQRHALVDIARQPDPNHVFRVHRERVRNGDAAARPERQIRPGDRPAADRRRAGNSRRSETAARCPPPAG